MVAEAKAAEKEFLSTPSARRATAPTPHRARGRSISIHALREEGDTKRFRVQQHSLVFLSTPSARRATGTLLSKNW